MSGSRVVTIATAEIECALSRQVRAARADVWRLLADFTSVGVMEGFVAKVEAQGNSVGDERKMLLTPALGGGTIVERLRLRDEQRGVFAYQIVDLGSLPFGAYRGEFTLDGAGPAATILSYRAVLVPLGVSNDDAAAIVAGNFDAVVANLERLLIST